MLPLGAIARRAWPMIHKTGIIAACAQKGGPVGIDDLGASDEAAAYVGARYSRPSWATGSIGRADAAFLFDLIMRERPRALAEIGVASGVSTVFLATLLADRLRESQLYSFDKLEVFYDDPSRPVGAHIKDIFDNAPTNLTLATGVKSTDIRHWPARPARFDFVFLDANHMHPWPCLDLLSILDLVEPGAWIALHDIRLPLRQASSQAFGPLYLYQSWPGERCVANDDADIGAIRLYEEPSRSAAALIECCRIPWQNHIPFSEWHSALEGFPRADFQIQEELRSVVARPQLAKTPNRAFWEITIRGPNPWSRIPPDLSLAPLILHANRRGEPAMSVTVRGLRRNECSGIVFPGIRRSPEAPASLHVALSLVASSGAPIARREISLDGPEVNFAFLSASEDMVGTFDLEITVSLLEQAERISGAWVKFETLQFV
ncbi:class I SAM-dependent methyltransferase [Mesorhizobium sp. B2-3-5]|nr:class I SAM-dependent methyltransferase [Mesorhizobium sp. B2-3-5]